MLYAFQPLAAEPAKLQWYPPTQLGVGGESREQGHSICSKIPILIGNSTLIFHCHRGYFVANPPGQ